MAERTTQTTRRVGIKSDANARTTQATRRVGAQGTANARTTQVTIRVGITAWTAVGARVDVIEPQD